MKKIRDLWEKYLGIVRKYFWFWIWWVWLIAMGIFILFYYSTNGTNTVLGCSFRDLIVVLLAVLDYLCIPIVFILLTVCIWTMSKIALRKIKKDQQNKNTKKEVDSSTCPS